MWMHELDDNALLREFAARGSESAFAALVARHVDKVFSVALRHTRNPHAAEEITQTVFVILARKAGTLGKNVILSGWLYQTARLTAVTTIRSDIRRGQREQEVLMQNACDETTADPWPHIAPLLDDAMAGLSETDRHAVVLRYFDGKSLKEVAAALGGSEDAAKMRVSRAVEKLRAFFTKRGVTLSTVGLTTAIAANSVQSAPLGLAAAVTAAAHSGTALTTSAVLAATKTMAMTTLQKALVTVTVAVLAGAGIYEARQAAQLRGQIQTLQQKQVPLAEQVQQLQKEHDLAANRVAGLTEEIAANRTNNLELLRLRNEVTLLKRQPVAQSPMADDSWRVSSLGSFGSAATKLLNETKPQVRIVDSKYDHLVGRFTRPYSVTVDQSGNTTNRASDAAQSIGIGIAAREIILTAYDSTAAEAIFPAEMPAGQYDYIANLPQGSLSALREEIKTKFGLVGKRTMITTNAFALVHVNPDLPVIKEPKQLCPYDRLKTYRELLEQNVTANYPVVDMTGITNPYEWEKKLVAAEASPQANVPVRDLTGFTNRYQSRIQMVAADASRDANKQKILRAFHETMGIDLIATNVPMGMLVLEKIK